MKNWKFAGVILLAILLGVAFVFVRQARVDEAAIPRVVEGEAEGSPGGVTEDGVPTVPKEPLKPKVQTSPVENEPEVLVIGKLLDPDDPDGFTDFDVQDADRPVQLRLGDYAAGVGEEVPMVFRISGPAMESITLLVTYDGAGLNYIGKSATRGPAFRNGVEVYARDGEGRMAIVHTGDPGNKNLEATKNGVELVKVRMRAMKAGAFQLKLPVGQQSFTNALGEEVSFSVTGGTITISP